MRDATVDEAVHDVSVVEKSLLVLGDALGIDAVTNAERLGEVLVGLKGDRLPFVGAEVERAAFDATYEATRLALDVGEKVRDAREAAGLSQRELAARMGTSQAAVARLEAGGVGATLTTLQKVAAALDLKVTVELSAVS